MRLLVEGDYTTVVDIMLAAAHEYGREVSFINVGEGDVYLVDPDVKDWFAEAAMAGEIAKGHLTKLGGGRMNVWTPTRERNQHTGEVRWLLRNQDGEPYTYDADPMGGGNYAAVKYWQFERLAQWGANRANRWEQQRHGWVAE